MKRIILLLILFSVTDVYADTYYGEYKYVGVQNREVSDEVKYEEIKLYNTYRTEYIDLGYMEENDIYIKDENDYIENKVYTNEFIETSDEIVVLPTKNYNSYSLKLSNITVGTKINEIELYYKDEKIKYKLGYNNINNYYRINDNLFDYSAIVFSNNSYIFFDTSTYFDIHNLKMIIYTNELSINNYFNIHLNDKSIEVKLSNNKKHEYIFSDASNIEYKYLKNIKLYRYYKEEKIKEDIYVLNGDNILLDDYKYVKKYYKRDKLVLSDNNIIDETYNNPLTFIEYASDKVDIKCNINYKKNGIYKCIYKLNDIEVEKEITVNNAEEKIKEIYPIEQNAEIDNSKKTIIKYNNSKQENNKEIKNNKNTEKIYITKEAENNNKKSKFLEKIIKYIIIIFTLFIEMILFIKRKRKNVERV